MISTPANAILMIPYGVKTHRLGPPHLHIFSDSITPSPVKIYTVWHSPSFVNPPMKNILSLKGTVL